MPTLDARQRDRELAEEFAQTKRSDNTVRSYRRDLRSLLDWLHERDRGALDATRGDIDAYRRELERAYAPSTAHRRLVAVRGLYQQLVDDELLDRSPAARVRPTRVDTEPRGKALSEPQLRRLLEIAEAEGPTEHAIVCLLALNGLRVSEVCAAAVEDLEQDRDGGRELRVRAKGERTDYVALNARTAAAVCAAVGPRRAGPICRRQRRDGAFVPYNQQAVARLLERLGRRAGLVHAPGSSPPLTRDGLVSLNPHLLRHTFVTLLLDKGVSLPAVQDAARHRSADTTRLYDRKRTRYREHPTHVLSF